MARARNIKPGFFSNDLLAEIPPLGRILFAGLWTIADREGRLEDRPKKIKAQVLPYDECSVSDLLDDLANRGFIIRYAVDEDGFIQVQNWKKHQQPHIKEGASAIPAPDEPGASTVQVPGEPGIKTPDSLNLIPDSLNPIPSPSAQVPGPVALLGEPATRKKTRKTKGPLSQLPEKYRESFDALWDCWPAEIPNCWDKESRCFASKPVNRGAKGIAETRFAAIVGAGFCEGPELYASGFAYITESPKVKEGFVQSVETFLGPEKRTFEAWITRGRALLAALEEIPHAV